MRGPLPHRNQPCTQILDSGESFESDQHTSLLTAPWAVLTTDGTNKVECLAPTLNTMPGSWSKFTYSTSKLDHFMATV